MLEPMKSKSPLEIACEILSREARALPIAVEPAIHGFHFEKILERVAGLQIIETG